MSFELWKYFLSNYDILNVFIKNSYREKKSFSIKEYKDLNDIERWIKYDNYILFLSILVCS